MKYLFSLTIPSLMLGLSLATSAPAVSASAFSAGAAAVTLVEGADTFISSDVMDVHYAGSRPQPRYYYQPRRDRLGFGPSRYVHPPYYIRPRYGVAPGVHRLPPAHISWCRSNYRSYRISDDTFQPRHGPRQRCLSPHLR